MISLMIFKPKASVKTISQNYIIGCVFKLLHLNCMNNLVSTKGFLFLADRILFHTLQAWCLVLLQLQISHLVYFWWTFDRYWAIILCCVWLIRVPKTSCVSMFHILYFPFQCFTDFYVHWFGASKKPLFLNLFFCVIGIFIIVCFESCCLSVMRKLFSL